MRRFVVDRIRDWAREETGSIAVEFALVTPILLLILAATVDIGSAAFVRLAQEGRVTAAADYALLQSAPSDNETATSLARKLAGLLRGTSEQTAEVEVNNSVRATWNGSTITVANMPGDAVSCYCPTLSGSDVAWGPPLSCGAPCSGGDTAGRFVRISANARHVVIFPGYAFMEADAVVSRSVVRLP